MPTKSLAAALAILVIVFAATEASAQRITYEVYPVISSRSGVDLTTGTWDFVAGSVDSDSPRCERGRTVSLYSTARGLLATATTDHGGHGAWRIDGTAAVPLIYTEVYFITVPRFVYGRPGHRRVCQAERSPNMRF